MGFVVEIEGCQTDLVDMVGTDFVIWNETETGTKEEEDIGSLKSLDVNRANSVVTLDENDCFF